MLTPELVRTRRRQGELEILPLGKHRTRAEEIAATCLELAHAHVGRTRGELEEAFEQIASSPGEYKLAAGLAKLVLDACELSQSGEIDPAELRSELFLRASKARQILEPGARFDRRALLAAVSEERGTSAEAIEAALFADLRSAHVLKTAPRMQARALVDEYERGQRQAVMLRAAKVIAEVRCASAGAYRELFRKLKFRRLLHRIEHGERGGYRIEIDGPFSLFESVTKYGLELALVLPALEACDELRLVADVRWGKSREPLLFKYAKDGGALEADGAAALPDGHISARRPSGGLPDGDVGGRRPSGGLPDDVAALKNAFDELGGPWQARPTAAIVELPGVGLCVTDLEFLHTPTGSRVLFEALGYFSRDAVWRRVELAQHGLATPMLFAVSSRLRVSPEVLGDIESAALYVYKGTMSARAVERHLEALRTAAAS